MNDIYSFLKCYALYKHSTLVHYKWFYLIFYVAENYEYLKSLLSSLVPIECSGTISGWSHQGQLLWEYMEITSEIQSLLKSAPDYCGLTYQLETLKPRLTNLCHKIDQFPCLTAKHKYGKYILLQAVILYTVY